MMVLIDRGMKNMDLSLRVGVPTLAINAAARPPDKMRPELPFCAWVGGWHGRTKKQKKNQNTNIWKIKEQIDLRSERGVVWIDGLASEVRVGIFSPSWV